MQDINAIPSTENSLSTAPSTSVATQPIRRVCQGDVEYVLLGTAHVSRASVEAVRDMIEQEPFDAIAIELCQPRYATMQDPHAFRNLDLLQVIRQGKAGLVAANLALSAFQRRIAEQFGIEPGAEMKAAAEGAAQKNLPLWLIDREVGITLKRAYRSVGFFDRMGIIGGLGASLLTHENVSEEEIEKLKEGDILESAFSEFARTSTPLYAALINERDHYMAARLLEETSKSTCKKILVVIGAGHLSGIEQALMNPEGKPDETCDKLNQLPPPSRLLGWITAGIFVLIAGAIAFAFTRGLEAGTNALRDWAMFTSLGAALGALLAAAHPFSILAAAITAPLKPFRPGIPTGAISAAVEVWLRRPRVADFDNLRDDVIHWTGWWKNRVSRTLLIFLFVNMGSVTGQYIAGIRIIKNLL